MNWSRTLDIKAAWQQASDRTITPQRLAKIIANKIESLKEFGDDAIDWETEGLIVEFLVFSEEPDGAVDFDDLDYILSRLYDWGDTQIGENIRVCWIKTF